MSARTPDAIAEKVYTSWHSGNFESQRELARAFGLTPSTTNHIVNGEGSFAELKQKFPNLKRDEGPNGKVGRPAVEVPAEESDPISDLAHEALTVLPDLCPASAALFAKVAYPELSELLSIINRPCPRLERILGPKRGRPIKSEKAEATKQAVEEEQAVGAEIVKQFLGGEDK